MTIKLIMFYSFFYLFGSIFLILMGIMEANRFHGSKKYNLKGFLQAMKEMWK